MPPKPNEGATVTVHILEDDPGVSDSLDLLLRGMGHRTIAYPDAESFFEGALPAAEDTVLVDLRLPGISGAQVIRWLRGLESPPRVIAISGQARSAIEAQTAGIAHLEVLRKPLNPEKLAALL